MQPIEWHVLIRDRAKNVVATALIDMEEAGRLSRNRWCLMSQGYAGRRQKINGRKVGILMHRQLLGFPREVDHINRNRLDNRKKNLRAVSHLVNCQNRDHSTKNTSGIVGVSYVKERGNWLAQIGFAGKVKNLGRYPTPEEAHRVYLAAKAAALATLQEF